MNNNLDKSSVYQYHFSDFYNKNYKIINSLIIVVLILIISFLFSEKSNIEKTTTENETVDITNVANSEVAEVEDEKTEVKNTILVYITGEVKNPSVYELVEESRLQDLVNMAGGFTENAYIENLNLAKKLYDEDHIKVLNINDFKEDVVYENSTVTETNNNTTPVYNEQPRGKININTASKSLLTEITGVGEKTANNIIKYRELNGGFKSIEEIMNISGIGEATFLKMKDEIAIR